VERINIVERENSAAFFLLAAIAKYDKDKMIQEANVEVEIKINGIEFPFKPVIDDLFERFGHHFDEQVYEKAKQLVAAASLDNLRASLERAEYEISNALEMAMQNMHASSPQPSPNAAANE
jgi:hypothetical protein